MGDQPEPVHGHENTVDAGEGQPEMKFAERYVQAAAKKFREPEKECAENGECRSDAHDEVEMAGDEIVADGGSGGEIVARQENSGKSAREKERNETEREKHRGVQLDTRVPECGEPTDDQDRSGQSERRSQQGKNQQRRRQRTGTAFATAPAGWVETKFTTGKKCVPIRRSESKQTQAARRMLKISAPRMALMNQAQTVNGRRGRVMPWARRSIVVTLKLSALRRDAAQKMATLTIQSVMAGWGEKKNVVVMPKSETAVSQNARRFSSGKAISRAPICRGRK